MNFTNLRYYISYLIPFLFLIFILFILDINNQLYWLEFVSEFVDFEPALVHGMVDQSGSSILFFTDFSIREKSEA